MPEAIISAKGTEAPTVRSGRFTILNVGMANYPELMPAEDDTPEATGAASRQATAPDETGIDHQTLRKNRFE